MTSIKDIYRNPEEYKGRPVTVCGWIRTIRDSKTIGFIELNDGSFFKNLQIVFEESRLPNFREICSLNAGSALRVTGALVESPGAKQLFEISAQTIEVEGGSVPEYPLQKKRHTMEYLRTIAHLRPRANTCAAVFRIRSLAAYAVHRFFQERGFVYVNTPIITSSDCEGAGEAFRVTTPDPDHDFFGRPANLTVSGQLEGEAFAMTFGKIYTFGPTFRAENSNTPRHAAEFWMIEPEIAFADINDDMDLAENMVKYIISFCLEEAPEEMQFFNAFIDNALLQRLQNVLDSDFERITYTEAVDILQKSGRQFEYPVEWGSDLQTEHERFLTDLVYKKPVFVTDYPKDKKAFYMRLNDDEKTVAAMDLLVPGVGEIIGGSQREERLHVLEKRMDNAGLNKENYWWYLDLRKYGGVKHAGFGLGFERAIMYLTGINNIRDVIPFPRTPGNAEF